LPTFWTASAASTRTVSTALESRSVHPCGTALSLDDAEFSVAVVSVTADLVLPVGPRLDRRRDIASDLIGAATGPIHGVRFDVPFSGSVVADVVMVESRHRLIAAHLNRGAAQE
jgi:hypothetical protein